MRVYFECKTNKPYMMINTATFHLADGGTITLDRQETEFSVTDDRLEMLWKGVYFWAINERNIFSSSGFFPDVDDYTLDELKKLFRSAKVELNLEDDAPDEDYEVKVISFYIE